MGLDQVLKRMDLHRNDRGTTIFKGVVTATALALALLLVIDHLNLASSQSVSTELAAFSIDGGGSEMSGGALTMDYAVAEEQPIGEASSTSYTLDSGFVPIIAQSFALSEDSSATPTPTPVPGISVLGIMALATLLALALAWGLIRERHRKPA